jgi:hypothetical protein
MMDNALMGFTVGNFPVATGNSLSLAQVRNFLVLLWAQP